MPPPKKDKKLLSRVSFVKYLRDNIPGYDESRVYVSPKNGSQFEIVVSSPVGKLIKFEAWDSSWSADLFLNKIKNYLIDGVWDTGYYVQPYTVVPGQVNVTVPYGPVIRFRSVEEHPYKMDAIRKAVAPIDLGFREVDATPDFQLEFLYLKS